MGCFFLFSFSRNLELRLSSRSSQRTLVRSFFLLRPQSSRSSRSSFHPFSFSLAVLAMAHTKSTANSPPSSQNPPPQVRRVAPGANPPPARNPQRASGAPSNQAERPTSSHANPTQATPPIAGGASLPPKDYKELYPWATPTLLKETSSINTELGVLRLRKGCLLYTSPSPRD